MSVIDDLEKWFSGARKIVLVGVGNPFRRDDNIGVAIVDELEGRVSETVLLIKSETVPESFIEPIIEFGPTHILILDAALLNLSPGAAVLELSFKASGLTISTHTLPLLIFYEFLVKTTHAKIAMLLIQPDETGFGTGLTPKLQSTKKQIAHHLTEILESVIE